MIDNAISLINKIDDVYTNSPTAQTLAANAPVILKMFRDMKQDLDSQRLEIQRLCAEREYDLARFREVAPTLNRELSRLGEHIRDLQQTVREVAGKIGHDPNAQLVIDYTNQQIAVSINMFTTLSLNLMRI